MLMPDVSSMGEVGIIIGEIEPSAESAENRTGRRLYSGRYVVGWGRDPNLVRNN